MHLDEASHVFSLCLYRCRYCVRAYLGGIATQSRRPEQVVQSTNQRVRTAQAIVNGLGYAAPNPTSTDVTVEVDTPDGQHVVASFDFSRLR